jgi:hypothetical protein
VFGGRFCLCLERRAGHWGEDGPHVGSMSNATAGSTADAVNGTGAHTAPLGCCWSATRGCCCIRVARQSPRRYVVDSGPRATRADRPGTPSSVRPSRRSVSTRRCLRWSIRTPTITATGSYDRGRHVPGGGRLRPVTETASVQWLHRSQVHGATCIRCRTGCRAVLAS